MTVSFQVFFCLFVISSARVYVNVNNAKNGDGSSWQQAFLSLQDAFKTKDNEIWVAQGTYYPSVSNNRQDSFAIDFQTHLIGGFQGNENTADERDPQSHVTVLSGDIGVSGDPSDNSYHVVSILHEQVTIEAVTITHGSAAVDTVTENECKDCYGGGIYLGIYNSKANIVRELTLKNVILEENTALNGGGLYVFGNSNVNVYDSTFIRNEGNEGIFHGGMGGALYLGYGATVNVYDSTFQENQASFAGGGITLDYGCTLNVQNSHFEKNSVKLNGNGGAIAAFDRNSQFGGSHFTVKDSNFLSNSAAQGYGGALFIYQSTQTKVDNCVLKENVAQIGGGIATFDIPCDTCCEEQPKFNSEFQDNVASVDSQDCFEGDFDRVNSAPQLTTEEAMAFMERLSQQEIVWDEPSAATQVFYVNGKARAGGDGLSWATASQGLQVGINKARAYMRNNPSNTAEVWVAGGQDNQYIPTVVPNWYNTSASYFDSEKSKMIEIHANVMIFGGFKGTEKTRNERNFHENPTFISGFVSESTQVYQVVYVHDNTWLDGFFIYGGKGKTTGGSGGGDAGSSATSADAVLHSPNPTRGSGIFANASATIANSVIYSNFGLKGGGIYGLGNTVEEHKVSGYNLAVVSNAASIRAGGIGLDLRVNLECSYCIIEANLCRFKGGGVYSDWNGQATFKHCTFAENSAYDRGGAIGMDGSSHFVIEDTSFSNNNAFMDSAAVYSGSYNPYKSSVNIFEFARTTFSSNECDFGTNDLFMWPNNYATFAEGDTRRSVFQSTESAGARRRLKRKAPGPKGEL